MKYRSTRSGVAPVCLSEAIRVGQAADGGLFLPDQLPAASECPGNPGAVLPSFAAAFLAPFFEGDRLADDLPDICAEAFDIPIPEIPLADGLSALELFHGPTGAFKDFGARFLMACLDRLGEAGTPFTVLVATSGDTGGAVGCAAEGRSGLRAVILFPQARVSPFQAHQLSCWKHPVTTLQVKGDFDTCQTLVKAAFSDRDLAHHHRLTSANSINIARLLPQAAYLAFAAARHLAETGQAPGLIIPTGNLGHGVAALIARACGAPLGPVILATNANAALSDWSQTGTFQPRPSVRTIANAMDVGAPSNFERLAAGGFDHSDLAVERISDQAIRTRIALDHNRFGYVWCPHSACGAEAFARLSTDARSERHWMLAATAHPYKFADIVEPVIGESVEPPPALSAVLKRTAQARPCAPDLAALAEALEGLIPQRD